VAKIKFGAVISDSRGSVEGITFSRNRFGGFVRKRQVPRRQQTTFTQPVRSAIATLSRDWFGALSQVQRDGWVALAAANPVTDVFGNNHILTGQQFFIRVNQIRRQAGLSFVSSAPADQAVTGLATLSVVATAPATLSISFTVSPLTAGHRLYLFATPSLSPGKVASKQDASFIGVSGTAIASPFAAGSLYMARHGDMVSGRLVTVFASVLRDDRGALAPFLVASDVA
jgi:hypothetical protein